MKIWVVTYEDYDDFYVVGVYDSEELAVNAKAIAFERDLKRHEGLYKKQFEKWPNLFHINEMQMNQDYE